VVGGWHTYSEERGCGDEHICNNALIGGDSLRASRVLRDAAEMKFWICIVVLVHPLSTGVVLWQQPVLAAIRMRLTMRGRCTMLWWPDELSSGCVVRMSLLTQ
jgi:hypothetical protein